MAESSRAGTIPYAQFRLRPVGQLDPPDRRAAGAEHCLHDKTAFYGSRPVVLHRWEAGDQAVHVNDSRQTALEISQIFN